MHVCCDYLCLSMYPECFDCINYFIDYLMKTNENRLERAYITINFVLRILKVSFPIVLWLSIPRVTFLNNTVMISELV